MAYRIRIKRGLKANLPARAQDGEPLFTTDTGELFMGRGDALPLLQIYRPSTHKGTTAPANPMNGDLWYNPATNETRMWDGDSWEVTATASHTYAQDNQPTSGMFAGDLWIDTNDGNKLYRYNGTSWTPLRDAGIASALAAASSAQSTADGKIKMFYQPQAPTTGMKEGDIWVETDNGNHLYVYQSGQWTDAQDSGIANALTSAATAQATADGKVTSYFSPTAPASPRNGDLWYNETDNKLYRWKASTSQWKIVSTVNSTFSQGVPPTEGMVYGDLWIDTSDGNRLYRYGGSGWVQVRDAGIATAQARADAAMAAMDELADDGKITPPDKKKARQAWAQIVAEGNPTTGKLPMHAAAIGVAGADIAVFNSAYTALGNYLNTTLHLFTNMAATTAVIRQDWDDTWNGYYNARVDLQKEIANQAAQTASIDSSGALKGSGGVKVSNDHISTSHLQGAGKPFAAGTINGSGRPVINLDDAHVEGTYGRTKSSALDDGVPRKEVQHLFPTARLDNTGDKMVVNNMVG